VLVTTCTRTVVPLIDDKLDDCENDAVIVTVCPPLTVVVGDILVDVAISAPVLALSRLTCVIVTGVVPVLVTTTFASLLVLLTFAESTVICAIAPVLLVVFAMNPLTNP